MKTGEGQQHGLAVSVAARWVSEAGHLPGFCELPFLTGMYKPVLVGICRRFGAVDGVGLVEDIAYMVADGFDADDQLFAYLLAGLSGTDTAQHFNLSLGQAVGESRQRCRLGFGLHLKDGYPLHERRHSKLGGD